MALASLLDGERVIIVLSSNSTVFSTVGKFGMVVVRVQEVSTRDILLVIACSTILGPISLTSMKISMEHTSKKVFPKNQLRAVSHISNPNSMLCLWKTKKLWLKRWE